MAAVVIVLIAIVVWIGSCGGDEPDATAGGTENWSDLANAYCADGIQEAGALALPSSAREVAADAAARIRIVAAVRDGIYTLGEPADLDPALVAVYLGRLEDDLDALDELRRAASSGEDYSSLSAGLGESSGEAAAELGLTDCTSLSQTIARTP